MHDSDMDLIVHLDVYSCFVEMGSLGSVHQALKPLVKWKKLGLNLGLQKPTLEKIALEQRDDVEDCKMEMLAAWLRWEDDVQQKGQPSWRRLLDALKGVDAALTTKIESSTPWQSHR